MTDEFTRAYREHEARYCSVCGRVPPEHLFSCPVGRFVNVKPFPAEWAASHTESVADAVNREWRAPKQSRLSQAREVALYIVGGVWVALADWLKGKRS